MKTAEPFGYAVTSAGLPRDWCTIPAYGDENIPNLTARELARIFWLLESIRVEFAYSVNGKRKERDVLLESTVAPKKRIAMDPVFRYVVRDPEDESSCEMQLELSSIAHCPKSEGHFHLNFWVKEQDADRMYTLSCKPVIEERLLDSERFGLFGRELTVGLWTASTEWLGRIEYFRVMEGYYEVE